MSDYQSIKISGEQAASILLAQYGIEGKIDPLAGEIDFNFRVKGLKGKKYILKVSRPKPDIDALDFQEALLAHLESSGMESCPRCVPTRSGDRHAMIELDGPRSVRLLSWVEGRLWSSVNPQKDALRFDLGKTAARLTNALSSFDHPYGKRTFVWDIAQAGWTIQHLSLFDENQKTIITNFQQRFEAIQSTYGDLRKQVIHNDANDNNIVVSKEPIDPKVTGIIDYGDAIHTQLINDVAVCCTYAVMGLPNPLAGITPILAGYHEICPLTEAELDCLYDAIAMRLIISLTRSAINREAEPDNVYLQISDGPGWDLLTKWYEIDPAFAKASFRQACGYLAHRNGANFEAWAAQNPRNLSDLFPTSGRDKAALLDLSVSSSWLGHQYEFNDLDRFQFEIEQLQKTVPDKILAGGYQEPRPLYTSGTYGREGNSGMEDRTVHLGIDFWLPAGTPVHALWDGEVVIAADDAGEKEYGGLIVLKHQTSNFTFYSLYGHLNPVECLTKQVGDLVEKGTRIGALGNYPENGNWAPHLHFQLMHELLGYTDDFPGVAYPSERHLWAGLCPDPNLVFQLDELKKDHDPDRSGLIDYRKVHLGKSLSLQYESPLEMVRGAGAFLMDRLGCKYLDTVNNVAHVGHEHPNVVEAGKKQMSLINTNTRYLHPNINALAEKLLETLPTELSVLHFVNSGSEANELAIRMAYAYSGGTDVIASEVGYHGNTNQCVAMSSYKFDGKGGQGRPEHTEIFPMPYAYRGKYRGQDTAPLYANEVATTIERIQNKNRKPAALILEPILSCGGQVELPEGFLKQAYELVRDAGAVCISDEVQTGCGRMGKTFWGFQLHGVVPDIVTIGKPLGNGHPVAAVACTRAVADAFANGMEYFNTFGGNPVSCAIAKAVLDTVQEEGLQQQAQEIGDYLKDRLWKLQDEFALIGDIRGQGLFLGIELVDPTLRPMPEQASYLANRMKDHGILMSTDGPDHNVLKIKPPLVFNKLHADLLLKYLRKVLKEDFMSPAYE